MPKKITVISGKGGTGKTTLTAAFASLANKALIADCDVDAADIHLILAPESTSKLDFYGMDVASINAGKCSACGICVERCRFGAISKELVIDSQLCEGCGVCSLICPEDAVIMKEHKAGEIFKSGTRFGPLVHARLGIGEETGGKLVSMVRRIADEIAIENDMELIIIDGPPGTGCSLIASISGVDLVFVVTEPSVSGMHDLERLLEVIAHFEIKAVVCINKYNINEQKTRDIEEFCKSRNIDVIGKLPLSEVPIRSMLKSQTVIEYDNSLFSGAVRDIWHKVITDNTLKR